MPLLARISSGSNRTTPMAVRAPAIASTFSCASPKVTVRQPSPERSASQTREGAFSAQCDRAAVIDWNLVE